MEELLKILLSFVATTNNMTEDQAAELVYQKSEDGKSLDKTKLSENALTNLLDADKTRVATLKTGNVDKTKVFNDAYAKAKKEVLEKAEKQLADKHGIENSEKKLGLQDLVDTIVSEQLKAAKVDKNAITEDDIKKHPTYLALEKSKTNEITSLTTAHEKALQDKDLEYSKKDTLTSVKEDVLSYFDALKPILSKKTDVAVNQRNQFATMFDKFEYQKQEDGSYLVLKDDKRVEDDHGNPISLQKLVSTQASNYYDFAVQDPKGAPGNEDGAGGKVTVPADEAAYNDAIFNATTSEERVKITEAYEASSGDE